MAFPYQNQWFPAKMFPDEYLMGRHAFYVGVTIASEMPDSAWRALLLVRRGFPQGFSRIRRGAKAVLKGLLGLRFGRFGIVEASVVDHPAAFAWSGGVNLHKSFAGAHILPNIVL